MKQTCILVLGMHRSGTSALTGLLGLLDVYLGSELMQANVANEKGYFENNVLYKINEKLLNQINSSWDDVFYNEEKVDSIKEIDQLKKAIKSEFEHAKTFAIKDPRLAFLFPVYKKVLQDLDIDIKIILPYRNPVEVANSLHKRDGMPLEKGMLLWMYHFLLAEKFSREYDRVFIGFDELISNNEKAVSTIVSKLSLNLQEKYIQNKKEIDEFLEPSLKHHNISMDNLSDDIPKITKDILALKDKFNSADLSKEFDELRKEVFSYQKLFYNAGIANSINEGQKSKQSIDKNILWHNQQVTKAKRSKLTQQKPCILWFTGLSGSGKSTIANALEEMLCSNGNHTYLLDGDNIRHGLNSDLGFDERSRVENIRRIGEVAKLFVDSGQIVLTAFISPFANDRQIVKNLVDKDEFIEVFIDTPLEVCESRDPKGLYKKARAGEIKDFTGIDSPYEAPVSPDIHIINDRLSIEKACKQIIDFLIENNYIKYRGN